MLQRLFARQTVRSIGFLLLLIASVWIIFLPALQGGFVWDDAAHVTAASLRSLHGLHRIWFELGATQQFYPLLHSAFWAEHRLWGDSPVGYHAVNVLFHAVGAWLFWLVLKKLELKGAWVAGLAFAFHPVCVESVAWISEQKNTLSLVFYLGAALAYFVFDDTRRLRFYGLAFLLFLMALMTKSVTATLPASLLVILWWRRGRIDWARDAVPLLPWIGLGVGAGLFTAWVERTVVGAQGANYQLSFLGRILLAGRALCFYVGKLLWPSHLSFIYSRWTIEPGAPWQYAFPLAVLVAFAVLFFFSGRTRGPLACALLFAGALFPVLGFFNLYPFAYSFVADHFQYQASLPLFAGLGVLWNTWASRKEGVDLSWRRLDCGVVAVALVVFLALDSHSVSRNYSDAETLYRATLVQTPDCALAHNNLGVILSHRGEEIEAIAHFEAALRTKPDFPEAENNMGDSLSQMPGRGPDAALHYASAIRINPLFFPAFDNLGTLLAANPGNWPEAERDYLRALELRPQDANAHRDYAILLSRMPGRESAALGEYRKVLELRPNSGEAHADLAQELSRGLQNRREALSEYAKALALDPNQAETHYNFANELVSDPTELPAAILHYTEALRLRPNYPEAHNNLGIIYAGEGRTAEAIGQFELALKARPDFRDARDNLDGILAARR